jgi:glycosyltransferase involved in cell wall biosynthesis
MRPASMPSSDRNRFGRIRADVLVVAHSPYALERGRQLLSGRDDVALNGPGLGRRGAIRALAALLRTRTRLVYCIDIGMSTTVVAVLARLLRRRVVVDTGDAAYALAASVGGRSRLGLASVWLGEQAALRAAHHIVVRGHAHLALLPPRPATVIPDVAPDWTVRVDADDIRRDLHLEDSFVVGLVGSINLAPRLGVCYGWDLVEALPSTPPSVKALFVGDGDGLPWLMERASALGVADRCRFVGRVDPTQVARFVSAMDAGLSTQSNDRVGAVRTTGKLPLYLACGCPVIATDVGEAARLLGPLRWTLPYFGVVDREYPRRLAERIRSWVNETPARQAERREEAIGISRTAFDPQEARERLIAVLERARGMS